MSEPGLERLSRAVAAEDLPIPIVNKRVEYRWTLEQVPEGWSVFYCEERANVAGRPEVFASLGDAVDALIGILRQQRERDEASRIRQQRRDLDAQERLREDLSHNWSSAEARRIIADEGLRVNFLAEAPEPGRYSLWADGEVGSPGT